MSRHPYEWPTGGGRLGRKPGDCVINVCSCQEGTWHGLTALGEQCMAAVLHQLFITHADDRTADALPGIQHIVLACSLSAMEVIA